MGKQPMYWDEWDHCQKWARSQTPNCGWFIPILLVANFPLDPTSS